MRWIDTNKGTKRKPNYRSRLVAPEFKQRGKARDGVFASMPPLEAKKVLMVTTAQRWQQWKRGRGKLWKMLFIDVRMAHLVAKCVDPLA